MALHTWYGKLNTGYWDQVVMSRNGQYQLATEGGSGIYRSQDSGQTWDFVQPTGIVGSFFANVGISASGNVMVTNVFSSTYGTVFVSTDYGNTWASGVDAPKRAVQLTVSPDASIIYASDLEDTVRVSYNSGLAWSVLNSTWNPKRYPATASGVRKWKYGAISDDNKYQILTVGGAATELSYPGIDPYDPDRTPASGYAADYGVWSGSFVNGPATGAGSGHFVCSGHGLPNTFYIMFNSVSGVTNVSGVGTSLNYYRTRNVTTDTFQLQNYAGTNIGISGNGTGEFITYGSYGGRFWVSQNSGLAWNEIFATASGMTLPVSDFQRCAVSSTGQHMVVTSKRNDNYGGHKVGYLFMSHDYGSTWNYVIDNTDRDWAAVAMTADGSGVLAAIGDLGTGSPSGYLWSSTNSGATWTEETTQTIQLDWHSLAVSADGTIYSAAVYNQSLLVGGPLISGSTVSYIGNPNTDFESILVPNYLTQSEFDAVESLGGLYTSVSGWVIDKQGDLVVSNRLEVAYVVVPELSGNQRMGGLGFTSTITGPNNYFKLLPISGLPRFSIDKQGNFSTGLLIFHCDYSQVYNVDVHNGISTSGSTGHTGIWTEGSSNVKLVNPRVYDLGVAVGSGGINTGGIHIGYSESYPDDSAYTEVINPVVYNITGGVETQGIYLTGANNAKVIGASVYNINTISGGPSYGIKVNPGTGVVIQNCISLASSYASGQVDYLILVSGVNTITNNMAGDGTASGAFAIQDGIPATEWVSPGADFTLNSSSQAKYVGLYISGYAYDFEYVSRGLSNWSMGAYQYPYAVSSGIVDGLLFSSGVLGTTSLYGSGILTPVYLSSMPMMLLKEETTTSGTFNKGLFSITVQSQIKDPWNFYLEAIHSIVSGVPTYVTYTASGSCVNQYGFYKELLELHAGLTDMESLRNQGVMWAQTVSGTYITSRIPVYFRKQS